MVPCKDSNRYKLLVRICEVVSQPGSDLHACMSLCAGGPLSISKELAQMFNFERVREVCVRKVEKEEVGLDLVELRFKVTVGTSHFVPFVESLSSFGVYFV